MKRKYVLMVPVAAVTLWANSFGVLVNAQGVQDMNNNVPAVWQQDDQNKQGQPNDKQGKKADNKQINKNDKQVQKQQNSQVVPKAPEKETVKKDKAPSKVTPETKEKRKVALANDYNNRRPDAQKPPVKPEDKKPLPPKDDKPAPQSTSAVQIGVVLNA